LKSRAMDVAPSVYQIYEMILHNWILF
jgi:hypothetical protein